MRMPPNPAPPEIAVTRRSASPPPLPLARAELAATLAAMLRAAGLEGRSLELALVDDARMEKLNAAATGCPGPTNILSFPGSGPALSAGSPHRAFAAGPSPAEPPGPDSGFPAGTSPDGTPPLFLGWMALSIDTLLRECLLYGQDPVEHTVRLLAHGLAHLTGLDHGPELDRLAALFERAATTL